MAHKPVSLEDRLSLDLESLKLAVLASLAERDALRAINTDLLAALKEILPWHDAHPAEATDNRIINLCRAAIAKAEKG